MRTQGNFGRKKGNKHHPWETLSMWTLALRCSFYFLAFFPLKLQIVCLLNFCCPWLNATLFLGMKIFVKKQTRQWHLHCEITVSMSGLHFVVWKFIAFCTAFTRIMTCYCTGMPKLNYFKEPLHFSYYTLIKSTQLKRLDPQNFQELGIKFSRIKLQGMVNLPFTCTVQVQTRESSLSIIVAEFASVSYCRSWATMVLSLSIRCL